MGKSRRARHVIGFKKGHVTISPVKERNLKTIASLWNSGYISKAALFYKYNYLGELSQMI